MEPMHELATFWNLSAPARERRTDSPSGSRLDCFVKSDSVHSQGPAIAFTAKFSCRFYFPYSSPLEKRFAPVCTLIWLGLITFGAGSLNGLRRPAATQ